MKQSSIEQIHESLKRLNGIEHSFSPEDFLIPTEAQNALLISQSSSDADLAICLENRILKVLQEKQFPRDFDLSLLPDLSVAVEELSHFNFFCVHASHERSLSLLEMEVQGEVDKFAFALDCLEQQNALNFKHALFEQCFESFQLGPWVAADEVERYRQAHQIARAFCRRLLKSFEHREQLLKEFFRLPTQDKLSHESKIF